MVHLIRLLTKSPDETRELGRKLGIALSSGDVVAMTGDLGTGKSVLARGILEALGVEGDMPSPSFVIVATYEGSVPVNHIDLYRLKSAGEGLDLGLDDLLYSDGVCIVEWADRLEGLLPVSRIEIQLRAVGPASHRLISITAADPDVKTRLCGLARELVRFVS